MRIFCKWTAFLFVGSVAVFLAGCGTQPGSGANLTNTNTNTSVSNSRIANSTNTNSTSSTNVEAKEPEQYQAKVDVKVETAGGQQNVALPTLEAKVARNATDRRMEFMMPAGGRVVFLDKAGKNYLVLPDRKQYAELDKESLGFEVRRLLMPEQIVAQVEKAPGMHFVGEENYKGRDAAQVSL